MNYTTPRRREQEGLSLLEIVIVLAVIVILIGVSVPIVLRTIELTEQTTTERQIDELEEGLVDYYRDYGRLPTSAEGLTILLEDPSDGIWKGPYAPVRTTAAEYRRTQSTTQRTSVASIGSATTWSSMASGSGSPWTHSPPSRRKSASPSFPPAQFSSSSCPT